ncbi:hypothetical protein HMI56_000161 [Coelomomyces lativittatus]|nr:hypothetical protein HMI56_000161 [Coelomomyces lativittatus]
MTSIAFPSFFLFVQANPEITAINVTTPVNPYVPSSNSLPSTNPFQQDLFRSILWKNKAKSCISYQRFYIYPMRDSKCINYAIQNFPSLFDSLKARALLSCMDYIDPDEIQNETMTSTTALFFLIEFEKHASTTVHGLRMVLKSHFKDIPCIDRIEPDTLSFSHQAFISTTATTPLNERQALPPGLFPPTMYHSYFDVTEKRGQDGKMMHDDTTFNLWGLDMIDYLRDDMYTYDYTGDQVHVYVLDSGVVASHPDFQGRASLLYEAPGTHHSETQSDCTGHGSHVSGIIAGTITGVAKHAWVHMLRVMGCENEFPNSNTLLALNHLEKIIQYPAIINLSIGTKPIEGVFPYDPPLIEKLKKFTNILKVPVIMSAGNLETEICDPLFDEVEDIIVVGSIDEHFVKAKSSNFGECVDIFAPGENIWSHSNEPEKQFYTRLSGTSQAAPFTTGIAALLVQKNGKHLTPKELLDELYSISSFKVVGAGPNLRRVVGAPLTENSYQASLRLIQTKLKNLKLKSNSLIIIISVASVAVGLTLIGVVYFFYGCYRKRKHRYQTENLRPRPLSEATLISSSPFNDVSLSKAASASTSSSTSPSSSSPSSSSSVSTENSFLTMLKNKFGIPKKESPSPLKKGKN